MEVLPEAAGPTSGTESAPGARSDGDPAPPLRLGLVGDSTAAGCGARTHDHGLPGELARALAPRTGRDVTWTVVGQHGATLRRIRHRLVPRLLDGGQRGADTFDLTVLLAGANDVLARRSTQEWRDDLGAVLGSLSGSSRHVVVTGAPAFASFPALGGALRRVLADGTTRLDEVTASLCAHTPGVTFVSSVALQPMAAEFFARDGFHPSEAGYARWAEAIADQVAPDLRP